MATNRRSADVAQKGNEPDERCTRWTTWSTPTCSSRRDGDARKTYERGAHASRASTPARSIAPYRARGDAGALWRSSAAPGARRRSSQPTQSKFPFTEAMTHFARALGAARSGDPAAAQKDVEEIATLRDALKAAKNDYWANEVEVMRLASLAWVALAEKRNDEALGLMRQAADIEDKNEKHIVTPGRLLPARELLGDMLMELKRPPRR